MIMMFRVFVHNIFNFIHCMLIPLAEPRPSDDIFSCACARNVCEY